MNRRQLIGLAASAEWVTQRLAKFWRRNLKDIARLGSHASGKAKGGGAVVMTVDIPWAPEGSVFEMMMFQIGQGVGHIRFAGEKVTGPDFLAATQEAGFPDNIGGRFAEQEFWAK